MAEKINYKEVIYKVAQSKSEMHEVFKIRYKAYVTQGYIRSNDSGMLSDKFDSLPNSIAFLAVYRGKPFGTMRLVIDSDECGLPMDQENFSQDINHLRNQGRKLAEVCKLACLKDNLPKENLLSIQKIMLIHAFRNQVNDLVITVIPKHASFYEKVLLFEKLNEGIYHSLSSIRAVSLRLNLDTLKECYRTKYLGTRLDLHKHFFGDIGENILL